MGIHPHAARLETPGNPARLLQIIRPDTRPQPHLGIVRAINNILLVLPRHERHDGPKGLLGRDPARVAGLVDDRGRDEVPRLGLIVLAADGDGQFLLLDVAEEGLDFFELHAVLHGAKEDAFFVAGADFEGGGEGHDGVAELFVDLFVDVDAFDGQADLAGVHEGEGSDLEEIWSAGPVQGMEGEGRYLLSCFLHVDVLADDGWVVASPVIGQ